MMQKKRILASILFVLISVVCLAQGPPPPGPPVTPPGFPIDGGVLLGMLVAMFYGVRKLMYNHKS